MTTSLKSIFSKIIYILLTCFILTRCEEKQELPKVLKPIDLTRELKFSKVEKFLFNEKKELVSHWKKNPGRFSELEQKNKWLNTQATFNTDKIFFINHSQDSILLSPNSSVEFPLDAGVYTLRFDAGILSENGDRAGRLVVELDGVLSPENSILLENIENWANGVACRQAPGQRSRRAQEMQGSRLQMHKDYNIGQMILKFRFGERQLI